MSLCSKKTPGNPGVFLFIGLRRDSQIRAGCLVTLWEFLLKHFVICNRQWNDYVIAIFPVAWGCDAVAVVQLKCINDSENLIEVAASAHWVGECQADLLFGVNDEYGAHGRCFRLIGVNHVVEC